MTSETRMDVREILHAALMTPTSHGWGLPLLLEGEPGTAKTSIMEEVGARAGLKVKTLIASIRQPADFMGYPTPSAKTPGTVDALVERWVIELADEPGLLFLDELNTAPPAVQAALLRVILEGVVGDTELDRGVRCIAAQNAVGDAAGGWDLAPPLANRFGHLKWQGPPMDDWSNWVLGAAGPVEIKPVDLDDAEDEVMAAWDAPWARARGAVMAFLRARPDLMHKMPTAGDDRSHAWPSRRTWEMAMRAMASSEVHELSKVERDVFIGAFIGEGASVELATWVAHQDLPDPMDVLMGRVTFAHNPERLDRSHAILTAIAALVVGTQDKDKQLDLAAKAWVLLLAVCETGAIDLAWRPATVLARASLVDMPEVPPVLKHVFPLSTHGTAA